MVKNKNGKLSTESLKRKAMFEASQKEYPLCLYPVDPTGASACPQRAIKSHSIQKSGKLAEVVEDDFVYAFHLRPQFDDPPKLPDFRLRSHNLATTFPGLCSEHDTALFAPIDNSPIDLDDEKHVFLLTYRTVLKEAHGALAVERWTADAYAEMVGGGVIDPNDSVSKELSGSAALNANFLRTEKREMDRLYRAGDYGRVGREVVWLPAGDPALAVSAYFSSGAVSFGSTRGKERFCALNVFPQDGRHVMVFSFREGGRLMAKRTLVGGLRYYTEKDREQPASRLVLEHCEDPVLRPSVYDSFPDGQKEAIRGYYFQTAMLEQINASPVFDPELRARVEKAVRDVSGDVRYDDPRINLFRAVA